MTRFTVLVAAPQPRSSVYDAALSAADEIGSRVGIRGTPEAIDLAGLGTDLLAEASSALEAALERVAESDVLLVASSQIHGTYTGLLKVFLDRLSELGLGHAVAIPLTVVNDLRNSRGIEGDLRVLLADLGAWVAEPGLVLASEETAGPERVVRAWADVAAPGVREAVSATA